MSRLKRLALRAFPAVLLAAPLLAVALAPDAPQDHRWIPLPESASDVAPEIDHIFYVILWITGIVFVLVEGMLLYTLFRFRHKEGRKVWFSHGNNTLEVIWTIVPALILIWIGAISVRLWEKIRMGVNGEPKIEVVGQQFQWMVRYAGADGRLGRTSANFVSDDNTFGLDPEDAHAVDDRFMVGTILLKKGEYVRIRIRSKDVLHSFFVPVFRFKQDAVPGMPVDIWVRPTESNFKYEGDEFKSLKSWQIACAELCGNSHTNMKGVVLVAENDEDYAKALRDNGVALWETTPPAVRDAAFFKNAKLEPEAASASIPAVKIPAPVFTAGGAAGVLAGEADFLGDAPAPRKVAMSGDPYCNSANPNQAGEELVVNGGKLANVFVYLDEGTAGKPVPPAPAAPVIFDQHGCWYKPHVFGIRIGQKLEIRNSDKTMHNIHGMGEGDLGFNEGMAQGGPAITKAFTTPSHGTKVKCDVHGWMGAWAHVMEHPWFAVSGADGKFSIPGVPPGDYTLHAWHETLGTQTVKVTVTAAAGGDAVFTFAKK